MATKKKTSFPLLPTADFLEGVVGVTNQHEASLYIASVLTSADMLRGVASRGQYDDFWGDIVAFCTQWGIPFDPVMQERLCLLIGINLDAIRYYSPDDVEYDDVADEPVNEPEWSGWMSSSARC